MADTDSQAELWKQATNTMQSDLNIPMTVIKEQSKALTKNWVNGFSELMFEEVKYTKSGDVDFTQKLKPRMMKMEYESVINGVRTAKEIEMPLMGAVTYPAIAFDTITFKLNYTVGTSDNLNNTTSAEGGGQASVNGQFGTFGFSASTNFKATSSETRTRTTDTRATCDIVANYTRVQPGEAIARLTEAILNDTMPAAGGSQTQPAA